MSTGEWKIEKIKELGKAFKKARRVGEKSIEEYYVKCSQWDQERNEEYFYLKERGAWKRLLQVTEQQWKSFEPKLVKVETLRSELDVGALGWGFGGKSNDQKFHWNKRSVYHGHWGSKPFDKLTEGERIAEELIDLLEDEDTKDLEFRQKIDALHHAREKARKQSPKARQELAEVLTTPRQRAILLLLKYID